MKNHRCLVLICCCVVVGCATEAPSAAEKSAVSAETPQEHAQTQPERDRAPVRAHVERLMEIADAFHVWGRVDESPSQAPVLCKMPFQGRAADVRMSEASDASGHAQKLYYLFASDRAGYLSLGYNKDLANVLRSANDGVFYRGPEVGTQELTPIPVGFTVVKQAFKAVEGPANTETHARWPSQKPEEPQDPNAFEIDPKLGPVVATPPRLETKLDDGKTYHVGDPAGLYIMTKVGEPNTPGTDEGWIYGTLTPKGELTGAGLMNGCMSCHAHAKHERLMGFWDRYRE